MQSREPKSKSQSKLYTFVDSPKFSSEEVLESEAQEISFDHLHSQMWNPEISLKHESFSFYQSQEVEEGTSLQHLQFEKQFEVKFEGHEQVHFYSEQDKTMVFGSANSQYMYMLQVNRLTRRQILKGEVGELPSLEKTVRSKQKKMSLQEFKKSVLKTTQLDSRFQTDKDDYSVNLKADQSFKDGTLTLNNFGFEVVVHSRKLPENLDKDPEFKRTQTQLQEMFGIITKKFKVSNFVHYQYISRYSR